LSTALLPLRLGFAGTPEFAVPALEVLGIEQRICAVFTQPDRPAGRGQPLHSSPVKTRAALRGFPVYQPASFKSPQTLELLRALALDALVVVAYGLILPPAALECPRLGCINIHASLLPRWRGAAPIQRALLAGDATTGVTIMRMDAGLDTGPVLAARAVDIDAHDTAKTLHDRLARLGADLIAETLTALGKGGIRELPQPAQGVTYAEKINKAEARIDWRRDATHIWRQVRAFYPWPVAETQLNGVQLRIWDAEVSGLPANQAGPPGAAAPARADAVPGTVLAAAQDGIDVACGRGVLRILRLQLAGRKSLCAREFIQGQRLDGARFAQA
jgi:methionyl-tRNA formyltransferase